MTNLMAQKTSQVFPQFWNLEVRNLTGQAPLSSSRRERLPVLFQLPVATLLSSLPQGVTPPPPLLSVSLRLTLVRTLVTGFTAHLDEPEWSLHLQTLSLHLQRPFFQETFPGSWHEDLGAHC